MSKPEVIWILIVKKFHTPYANDVRRISSAWNNEHLPGLSTVYARIPYTEREEFLALCLEFYLAKARFLRDFPITSQSISDDADTVRALIDQLD